MSHGFSLYLLFPERVLVFINDYALTCYAFIIIFLISGKPKECLEVAFSYGNSWACLINTGKPCAMWARIFGAQVSLGEPLYLSSISCTFGHFGIYMGDRVAGT